MPTPAGSTTPYATTSDFLENFDWRVVEDYLSDEGYRPTRLDALTAGTPVYNRLLKFLKQSSGEVEAAVLHGGQYTVADLQALTGNSLETLNSLVCSLTLGKVLARRADLQKPAPREVADAQAALEALAVGATVFALQEQIDAGIPTHTNEQPVVAQQRRLPTTILRRAFGSRTKDYPQG